MNGAQDLGGAHGFGPVVPEPDEPVFHADWERRVFAMAMAMGFTGAWNLDGSRATRESLPPAQYLASSYYEIWLAALEKQVAATGLATPDEIAAGRASEPARPVARVLARDGLEARFRAGFPSSREPAAHARFAVGDIVLARNAHPTGHTSCRATPAGAEAGSSASRARSCTPIPMRTRRARTRPGCTPSASPLRNCGA